MALDRPALATLAAQSAPHPGEQLNAAQRAAVERPVDDGPLLIVAGAGTGKTNTLAHRVARLVAQGAEPSAILLLTFSRRAAIEMSRRVERLLAAQGGRSAAAAATLLAWSGTFHAMGARLLRLHARELGLNPDFTIADREDAADLMAMVRQERGLAAQERRFPLKATCLAIYSRAVNTEAPLHEVLASNFPWCAAWEDELRRLFGAYVAAKQAANVLDYDDLLLYWAQALAEPAVARLMGARFSHVLVDEYQDTNRLQARILQGLKPDGRGLTVVGDDAQAIYAFRGATVRNILEFPAQYSPPAAVVKLEQNYRSTQAILAASNAVIGLAAERHDKQLWSAGALGAAPRLVHVADEVEEARYVAACVLEERERGTALKRQAVLFRTAHHSAQLELELARRNIPYVKYGGLKFLEAAHIKDVLAVLRWAENPRDRVAGFRVLQLVPGVGPRIAARLVDLVGAGGPLHELLAAAPVPAGAREGVAALAQLMHALAGRGAWPEDVAQVRAWYAPHLARLHEDATVRAADVAQLERMASTRATRQIFLTELALDPPEATSAEAGVPLLDEDYLILSTIHSAKGQEWNAVHVLKCVDGCIPSDMATGSQAEIEEERRLLYVAMTRARHQLHLMLPQRFYVTQQAVGGDRHVYGNRTRFIPGQVERHFERAAWPAPAAAGDSFAATGGAGAAPIDLAAQMRRRWE
jgi:DNA helicase-2/ATP-dependent DNA helicase PcrA